MLKKIAAAALVAGTLGLVAGPAAGAACVHASVRVNDVSQSASQCV